MPHSHKDNHKRNHDHDHGKLEPQHDAADDLSLAEQVEHKIREVCDKYEEIHDKVEDVSNSLAKTVKQKPLFALGVAVACGVLLGKLLK